MKAAFCGFRDFNEETPGERLADAAPNAYKAAWGFE